MTALSLEQADAGLAEIAGLPGLDITVEVLRRRARLLHTRAGWTHSVRDYQQARQAYETALKVDPNHLWSLRNAALTVWALADRAEAFGYVRRALQIAADDPAARRLLLRMFLSIEAEPTIEQAKSAYERGRGFLAAASLDDAIVAFGEAIGSQPVFWAYYFLGQAYAMRWERYHHKADLEYAREAFEEATEVSYGHPSSLLPLSWCLLKLGDLPAALEAAERCLDADPRFGRALQMRVKILNASLWPTLRAHRWRQAKEIWAKMDYSCRDAFYTPFGQLRDAKGRLKESGEKLRLFELPRPVHTSSSEE